MKNFLKALLCAVLLVASPVAAQQLQNGQVWGNATGAQALPRGTSMSSLLDAAFTCTAQGSVIYRSGSFWVCLAPGTSGQPLVSQGAAANLHYATLANAALVNSSLTVGSTNIALGATATTVAGLTLTTPTINNGALSGTFSGAHTYSGVPTYTGLSTGTCSVGLALNSSNVLVTDSCPGASSSIQDGTTAITSGVSSSYLFNNAGVLGHVLAATKSVQQAGTDTSAVVTPAQQQSHPSALKAWAEFDGTLTGTITPRNSYNITNVTKVSTGNYTANFTTAFSSSTSYNCTVNAATGSTGVGIASGPATAAPTATTWSIGSYGFTGTPTDFAHISIQCTGTQ